MERRNDPSGRERLLVPTTQTRNHPSGEERMTPQQQIMLESSGNREIPGQGDELIGTPQNTDTTLRQVPGGASPNEAAQISDDRSNTRIVTGSQEVTTPIREF